MTYFFIILVVAIALAPLSHFVPSKRQREIARMREYAAVHGLFVEFRNLPVRGSGRAREPDRAGQDTIYYGKRLPASRKKTEKARAWRVESGCWVSLERSYTVPPILQQLTLTALAASVDEASCGVYSQESGGVEAVEQIRQVLEAWSAELRD